MQGHPPPNEARRPAASARWAGWIVVVAIAWTVGVAASVAWAQAGAIELGATAFVEGSEILVTDAPGRRLLGYGRFDRGQLVLRLDEASSSWPSDLLFTIVRPDGTVLAVPALYEAGALHVYVRGRPEAIDEHLASLGIAVAVDRGKGPPDWAPRGRPDEPGRPDDDPGRPAGAGGG